MTVPAVPSFVQGLRNSRQSLGDGTLQGRVRSATPYRERDTSAGEANVTAPAPASETGVQRLFVRAIADQTIASGGDHIVWETEALPPRRGFAGWDGGASDEIIMPASGVLVVVPSWAWSTSAGGDGYVTHDGVDYPFMTTLTNPGATGTVWQPEPRYVDVEQGDVVKVRVSQSSGSGQTMVEAACEFVLWVTARKAVPPEVSGTAIYIAGGRNSSTGAAISTVEVFDGTSWTTAASMNAGRYLFDACGKLDGKLYSCGGFGADNAYLKSAEVYDPDADTWTAIADMPAAFREASAEGLDGYLYVTGGQTGAPVILDTVYRYDPAADSWSTMAVMPEERENHASVATGGYLWVAGGMASGGVNRATLFRYDPAADSWSTMTDMPTAAADPGAVVHNNKIHVLNEDVHYAYDIDTDSWSTLADPGPGNVEQCASLQGTLYSFAKGATFVYDDDADSWSSGTAKSQTNVENFGCRSL